MKTSKLRKRLYIIVSLISIFQIANGQNRSTEVFKAGDDGYSSYRIPAIIKAADNSLIAFAEARKDGLGDAGNIDLVMKKSTDGGLTWSSMKVVWDDKDNTCGNPAPVVLKNGDIVMLACWNLGKDKERDIERNLSEDTRRVYVTRSSDNGESWTEPKEITSQVKQSEWGWYATGPCHAIIKKKGPHKGRIIVSSNHSEIGAEGKPISRSQILYSDNDGRDWRIGAISQPHGNESTVAELKDGSLLLNMRTYWRTDSLRIMAISADGGETWKHNGPAYSLIEPICQGSILSMNGKNGKPGKTIIFSNPKHSSRRQNLTLTISEDSGQTWTRTVSICEGPSAYSDIVQIDAHTVGVLYENGDKNAYGRISYKTIEL